MTAGKRARRFGVLTGVACIALVTTAVVTNAAITISAPNCVRMAYSLNAGGTTAGITPATDTPVLLSATNLNSNNLSIGQATLVHLDGVMIRWVGLESTPSATIVHGGSTTPGTHIIYIDFNHQVDVEVLSADQIVVHNGAKSSQNGAIKLIW
jgi:hypothetical protein